LLCFLLCFLFLLFVFAFCLHVLLFVYTFCFFSQRFAFCLNGLLFVAALSYSYEGCYKLLATIEPFTMVVIVATPAEILQLGLQVVGICMVGRHETNMERFMAHFGTSPESCSAIFVDPQCSSLSVDCLSTRRILLTLAATRLSTVALW
jgi:hypothetical protein